MFCNVGVSVVHFHGVHYRLDEREKIGRRLERILDKRILLLDCAWFGARLVESPPPREGGLSDQLSSLWADRSSSPWCC